MSNVITRELGLGLPVSATVVEVVPEVEGVAPMFEVSEVGDVPNERDRSAELAIDKRLRRSIAARATAASSALATSASQSAATARAQRDALELQDIDSALREWVDFDKAAGYAESPSQLLRAVADFENRPIPPEFELRLDPSRLEDERIVDAAAVLYRQLRDRPSSNANANANSADMPALSELRSKFLVALRDDYAMRRALDALASPSAPSRMAGQKTPRFDGFAIRNAQRMTFDELAALPEVSADPAFATFPMDERRRLLEKKFAQMGESTSYGIGTPEHSLATALLRLQRYRGVPVPTQYVSNASMIAAFKDVEEDWVDNHFYPFHPRLLFAAHLARSNGIELMGPDDLQRVYDNRVSDPALKELEKGNDVPLKWIERHLSQHGEESATSWKTQSASERTRIILSLFAALREAADGSEPIAGFARELRDSGVLSEKRLFGSNQQERFDALIAYGNERLLAVFGRPPRFDRREAASAILRTQGVSDEALGELRHYVIGGDNPNISKSDYGDLVDEFLDRADWSGLVGSRMTIASRLQIVPRDELQRAEERFNEGLGSDPWVAARARENLWAKDARPTAQALDEEIRRIAGDLKTETEAHRAWVRGMETWVNTLPVAGPVYNIEEGVRHHDAVRAAFGLLFLGVDLFDVGTGGGRAGTSGRIHPSVAKMGRAALHLDGSMVDVATHRLMSRASADPVDIAVQDSDIPLVYRGSAQRVRNGEHVRWREYEVVYLEHENRISPVVYDGGVYYPIDWRSGSRSRTRSSLERDSSSGKLHPSVASAEGLDAARTMSGSDLETRFTVDAVKGVLKDADHAELRDFDRIFEAHFECKSSSTDALAFDAQGLFGQFYKRSRTFRRLVNHFDDINGPVRDGMHAPPEKWEIRVGDAVPLDAPTTDFEHRRIYMPTDATIETMQYLTATGFQPLAREQAYLHEMIHALTGARDPELRLDMLNRGPAVYLTDKILSESGYSFAEQVMYRRYSSPDMSSQQSVELHRESATHAAHAENRYLDPLVDGQRGSVPADTIIEGGPIETRITVRDSKEIMRELAKSEGDVFLMMDDFDTKFRENFRLVVGESTPTELAASDAKVLVNFYRRLYRKSETFRLLFEGMPTTDAAIWRFMLDKRAPVSAIAQGASLRPAAPVTKEIYLLDDGLRYLSSNGLRDVEFERKLTYDMVCAMGGFGGLPRDEAFLNRGPAVFLTDRILQEAGFHYPEQLVAALASAGDRAAGERLLAYQTSAQRSAAVEDRYLDSFSKNVISSSFDI